MYVCECEHVGVFMPEYSSYTAACVHHSTNDTFISSNLFSLAMNYAVSYPLHTVIYTGCIYVNM